MKTDWAPQTTYGIFRLNLRFSWIASASWTCLNISKTQLIIKENYGVATRNIQQTRISSIRGGIRIESNIIITPLDLIITFISTIWKSKLRISYFCAFLHIWQHTRRYDMMENLSGALKNNSCVPGVNVNLTVWTQDPRALLVHIQISALQCYIWKVHKFVASGPPDWFRQSWH